MLIKNSDITILHQIELERFKFNNLIFRSIFYRNASEIRKSGHRTDRGELRLLYYNVNVPPTFVSILYGLENVGRYPVRAFCFICQCSFPFLQPEYILFPWGRYRPDEDG